MIASIMAPLATAAPSAGTDAVLIDFGNGQVAWADVAITPAMNALNLTTEAATQLGLTIDAPGGFVNSIGNFPMNWPDEWWHLWLWNSSTGGWDVAMTGAATIMANSVAAIAWSYVVDPPSGITPAPLAIPDHRYPWTSFRHDVLNTGAQPIYTPNNLTLKWQKDLANGAIDAPVVAADGMEYVITGGVLNMTSFMYETNSSVFCLNWAGNVVWHADIGKGYQVGAPLLYGGMVLIPSANGILYAFDAKTGAHLWEFDTHSSLTYGITSSPIAYRNHIIFAAGNGKVYSLYENGSQAWNKTVASVIYSSSPSAKFGTIYIGGDDGSVHALAANGTEGEIFITSVGSKVRGSPILLDDKIIVTYVNYTNSTPTGGGVAALNYAGELLWQTEAGVIPSSATLTAQGYAVMTSTGMTMVGKNGGVAWTVPLGTSFPGAAPSSVGGSVFAVTNEAESRLVAVTTSGTLYWQTAFSPAQYALSTPTIAEGILYATSDNGKVYAFNLNSVAVEFTAERQGLKADFSIVLPSDQGSYNYAWAFGDGEVGFGATVNHTFATQGTYTVDVTVTNHSGQAGFGTRTVTVAVAVPSGIDFTNSTDGLKGHFEAVMPSDESLFTYTWSFGDGNSATGMAVNHTYAAPGSYNVTLKVENMLGENVTIMKGVTVATPASTETPLWVWGLIVVIAIVIVAAIAIVMRRGKK
jgi:outer membrane protein assembly factor BamB